MQTKTYNGATYVQDPRTGEWVKVPSQQQAPQQQTPQVVVPAPPPPPPQAPTRTAPGAVTEGLKPGFMWVDPNNPAAGQTKIPTNPTADSPDARERRAQIKTILGNIQRIRGMADETLAVGSWSEFLQGVPGVNQNRRNVEAALKQVQGDLIQQQIRLLAEANQGGVTGLANQATEAERMAASIAALGDAQSVPEFLKGLEDAEAYYLRQGAALDGKPEADAQTLAAFLPEDRRKELQAANAQAQQTALSADGQAVPIPSWYRESVARYLAENKGELDPSQYAAFRRKLDQEAGFPGDIAQYVNDGQQFRDFMAKGGKPEQIQIMQSFSRPTSDAERAMTEFAQTPAGAFTVSGFNSAAAGLPGRLSGNQEEVEAVRQNQPVASFLGDMAGGVAGSLGVGGAALRLGARGIAANPMAQNAVFGGVSGATQSEDPLTGAAIGAIGSIGGDMIGRQIGRQLPNVFKPRALDDAASNVPSGGDLALESERRYAAAMANGQSASPAQMQQFINDSDGLLRGNNYMDAQGNIIGTGPVQDAAQIIRSRAGQGLDPLEAKALRESIAEGRMAMKEGVPDNRARMFAGELTERFDKFAEAQDVMPGIAEARAVAQRRILGREMDRARSVGEARGDINYSQSGQDQGIRRAFGSMDIAEEQGRKLYPPELSAQIEKVSRGTPIGNALRQLGRAAPVTGVGASPSLGLGAIAGYGTGDPVTGLLTAATVGGAGLLGRAGSEAITKRQSQMASLIARDPKFADILKQIEEESAIKAGRIGGGLLGAAGIMPFRDY